MLLCKVTNNVHVGTQMSKEDFTKLYMTLYSHSFDTLKSKMHRVVYPILYNKRNKGQCPLACESVSSHALYKEGTLHLKDLSRLTCKSYYYINTSCCIEFICRNCLQKLSKSCSSQNALFIQDHGGYLNRNNIIFLK